MTIDTVSESIVQIQIGDQLVVNRDHITEFMNKADKSFFTVITDHVEKERDKFVMEPVKMQSTEDEIKAGGPTTNEIPVAFDQANFFG